MKVVFHPGIEKDLKRLFSRNLYYAIPRWIKDGSYEVKWAWQRVFRGYDDRVLWGLNYAVADIAIPALEFMRDKGMGTPMCIAPKVWKRKLNTMIEGFRAFQNDNDWPDELDNVTDPDFKQRRKWMNKNQKKQDRGMALFSEHFGNLWD